MCGRGYNYRTSICLSIVLTLLPLLFSAPQLWNFRGLLGWKWVGLQPMQTSSVFLAAKPFSAPVRVRSLYSPSTAKDPGSMSAASPKWAQKTITLPPQRRGCHLITPKGFLSSLRWVLSVSSIVEIMKEIAQDLSEFQCGVAYLFLQHTSASLTINENYDSDVRDDTETFLNRIVPEGRSAPWKHTIEGPDDMPAHIKSSMFGCTLTVPITNGQLNMGTWQGIWLCEHRDNATPRNVVVTLNGI